MYPGAYLDSAPDKAAVILADTGEQLSFAQLDDASIRLAHVFADSGLGRGDAIALLTDNSVTAFEVYWAAMRSGLFLTLVNSNLSADEVEYIVEDSGARALIVSAACAPVAEKVVDALPRLTLRLAYRGAVPGYDGYEDALARVADPVAFPDQPRGSDMLYSSGTTGRPKGIKVPLPDRQVDEPGDPLVGLFGAYFGLSADTVYLSPAPIYHAAPLKFCATAQALGGTVVIMRKFDAEGFLAAVDKYSVTHAQVVPTMFVRMLKLDDAVRSRHDVSSLVSVIHAAAPCPPDVKRAMIDWWGPILTEYYGSTEMNGATLVRTEDWLERPGTVGKPFLGVPRICDDDGNELPPGADGLVYFERDIVPFTYHNDPEKTRESQHPQHETWTTVGDIGHLDDDGFLYLTDRKSFMIISGGVNIYPQEVEDALALHPKVFDVAVIGVPDDEMGQSVKGVVKVADGVDAGPELEAELIAFLRERIAHYKVPRSVDFVDDVPRTQTGKLLKRRMVEWYTSEPSRR